MSLMTKSSKGKLLTAIGVLWCACLIGFLSTGNTNADQLLTTDAPSSSSGGSNTATSLPRAPYADWVHGVWVLTTTSEALDVVQKAKSHRINIAAVVLKDPFLFALHTTPLSSVTLLVKSLKAMRPPVKVVVTVDGVVPQDSSWYTKAKEAGYLVDNGVIVQQEDGRRSGALIDFRKPTAMKWLESLLNPLLKTGVEGIFNPPTDAAYMAHRLQSHSRQQGDAMEAEVFGATYYYELFDFGRKVVGFDFVTAFRPVDTFAHMPFRALGPQDISISSVVAGDKRPCDFAGIKDTALHMLHSADRGYINTGVGVCAQPVAGTTPELYERWVQLAVFSPFVMIDASIPGGAHFVETMCGRDEGCAKEVVRAFSWHGELRPYLHAQGSLTFLHKISKDTRPTRAAKPTPKEGVVEPFVTRALHTQEFLFHDPDSWDYLLGPDLFVVPVLNASHHGSTISERQVRFPSFGQWVPFGKHDHLRLHGSSSTDGPPIFSPKTRTTFDVPRGEALVFQRRGSIIPLETNDMAANLLTFTIACPQHIKASSLKAKFVPSSLRGKQVIVDEDGVSISTEFGVVVGEHDHGMLVSYETTRDAEGAGRFSMNIRATPYHRPIMVRLEHVYCNEECREQSRFVGLGYHEFKTLREFVEGGPRGIEKKNQHIKASSLKAKFVPSSLRGKQVIVDDDGVSISTEFGVVIGEHDHGMLVSYETTRDTEGVGRFSMNIRATPYHRPIMVRLEHVFCNEECREQSRFVGLGYHEFKTLREFVEGGPRGIGVRAVYLGPSEVFLYDPFASLGSEVNIGPLQDHWSA
ncbi:glycoside hydrolase family 31, putative [Bodo saltans]|uniref:Glycoside hydrolase family 31, putative n=1 Tax=Bodo saltans TaxID=75058 RepID=A0A0S4J259_BODSA|nr:glycoside hydrolase family 31, putative [Bodo saltans]|eukprot:CUG54817.1 glycoside hydrolase family 31, putative [Bodo saltans]